jgi:hypothetical protein
MNASTYYERIGKDIEGEDEATLRAYRGLCHILFLPPQRPQFHPRPGHVEFVVDEVALGQIFLDNFRFTTGFTLIIAIIINTIIILLAMYKVTEYLPTLRNEKGRL